MEHIVLRIMLSFFHPGLKKFNIIGDDNFSYSHGVSLFDFFPKIFSPVQDYTPVSDACKSPGVRVSANPVNLSAAPTFGSDTFYNT